MYFTFSIMAKPRSGFGSMSGFAARQIDGTGSEILRSRGYCLGFLEQG